MTATARLLALLPIIGLIGCASDREKSKALNHWAFMADNTMASIWAVAAYAHLNGEPMPGVNESELEAMVVDLRSSLYANGTHKGSTSDAFHAASRALRIIESATIERRRSDPAVAFAACDSAKKEVRRLLDLIEIQTQASL